MTGVLALPEPPADTPPGEGIEDCCCAQPANKPNTNSIAENDKLDLMITSLSNKYSLHRNPSRQKKQDVIFNILKTHSNGGEDIEGEGVLEILNDGEPSQENNFQPFRVLG